MPPPAGEGYTGRGRWGYGLGPRSRHSISAHGLTLDQEFPGVRPSHLHMKIAQIRHIGLKRPKVVYRSLYSATVASQTPEPAQWLPILLQTYTQHRHQ